jgi:hypothetical protein
VFFFSQNGEKMRLLNFLFKSSDTNAVERPGQATLALFSKLFQLDGELL